MVHAEDAGVEVVCSRAGAIMAEIFFGVFLAPSSVSTDILAVEQVAVDSREENQY